MKIIAQLISLGCFALSYRAAFKKGDAWMLYGAAGLLSLLASYLAK